jgi:hypothetical protein
MGGVNFTISTWGGGAGGGGGGGFSCAETAAEVANAMTSNAGNRFFIQIIFFKTRVGLNSIPTSPMICFFLSLAYRKKTNLAGLTYFAPTSSLYVACL